MDRDHHSYGSLRGARFHESHNESSRRDSSPTAQKSLAAFECTTGRSCTGLVAMGSADLLMNRWKNGVVDWDGDAVPGNADRAAEFPVKGRGKTLTGTSPQRRRGNNRWASKAGFDHSGIPNLSI